MPTSPALIRRFPTAFSPASEIVWENSPSNDTKTKRRIFAGRTASVVFIITERHKHWETWQHHINFDGRPVFLGLFTDLPLAVRACERTLTTPATGADQ